MLKASAASPATVLKALEVQTVEEAAQATEDQPGTFSENEYESSWSPSWDMWLGLPRSESISAVSYNNRSDNISQYGTQYIHSSSV